MVRPTDSLLKLLYSASSGNRSSRTMGRLSDLRLPRRVLTGLIRSYCVAYRVSLTDAEIPATGFRRFNDFFTRRLRPGARVIDARPDCLCSPSDGRVQSAGTVAGGMLIQAKGQRYRLEDLLGDPALVSPFEGGPYVTIYLSPRDYHRVHFPCDGAVTGCLHMPGRLFTVAPKASELVPELLSHNERVTTMIESRFGPVALVMVGAQGVGRISLSYDDVVTNRGVCRGAAAFSPPIPCRKGDELGVFNLGSTVVLVLPPGPWTSLFPPPGTPVRMGQGLFLCRTTTGR